MAIGEKASTRNTKMNVAKDEGVIDNRLFNIIFSILRIIGGEDVKNAYSLRL